MPSKYAIVTGQRFGRWVVIAEAPPRPDIAFFLCRCDCGIEREVRAKGLAAGTSRSCGCLHRDELIARQTKHGMYQSPEYRAWEHMLQRCHNPNDPWYSHYGDRGILVCDRWRESFANFLKDMGPRPAPGLSLERNNNDLGYSPENCAWKSQTDQMRNNRRNHLLTWNDETRCISEWAEIVGLTHDIIRHRIGKLGWTVERALTTPIEQLRNSTRNRMLTLNGKTRCVVDWAEALGVNPDFIRGRLKLGWSDERTLTEPINQRYSHHTKLPN